MPVGSSANITLGPRDERAGDGDALLLAAGELGRAVARGGRSRPTVATSSSSHAGSGLPPGELERQHDVLGRREHREQVEELEDEADVVAAQHRQLRVVEAADVDAGDRDLARGRLVEAGEDVHQRRLARARRAHDGGQAAGGDVDRDAAQGVDGRVALAVAADDVAGGDDRVAGIATGPWRSGATACVV